MGRFGKVSRTLASILKRILRSPKSRYVGRMPRLADIDLEATSIGGIETCIQLPPLDLAFDIGRCPRGAENRSRIFLTHTHMDHASGLAYHASLRDLLGRPPPTYFVPRDNLADLELLLATYRRLDRSDIPCVFVACGPGDQLVLGKNRTVHPFRSPHRIFCQGYAVHARKKKLRSEFVGLPDQELRRLRMEGVEIQEERHEIEVAFSGDATIDVVELHADVRQAKLLILECTFIDMDMNPGSARARGHVHLHDIIERADIFENQHILLTHFSMRYGEGKIVDTLRRLLPKNLRGRLSALLADGRVVGPFD